MKQTMHNPSHPGEILKKLVLEPLNLSASEAARHLGISRSTLYKILNGRGAVTPELAIRLEMLFGGPDASHWLRLQNAYDLWHTRRHSSKIRVKPIQPAARSTQH